MLIITMGAYEEKEEEKEEKERGEGGKTWGIEEDELNETKERQEEEQEEGTKKELFDLSFDDEKYSSDHWLFKPFVARVIYRSLQFNKVRDSEIWFNRRKSGRKRKGKDLKKIAQKCSDARRKLRKSKSAGYGVSEARLWPGMGWL